MTSGSENSSAARMLSSVRELVGAEVLVVDKDEKVRKGITQLLSVANLHVTCTEDPEGAVEWLGKKFFSVVVVDLDTPAPNAGLETVAQVRDMSPTSMVVMLTPRKSFTDTVAELGLQTALSNAAHGLVDECIVRDFKTFAGMSGIKGGLAVLEGSSVGVGFELEIGDLAQPLYDYVDFFWKALLYALVVLGFYKLLIEAGLLTVGLKIVGIGLLLLCG